MSHFICFDVETGGIPDECSLLTAYFGLFKYENNTMTQIDELNLAIKPDNGLYVTTAEGLSVNQIDLVKHDKNAIFQKKAGTLLYDKLRSWYSAAGNKLIPVGHNVAFDVRRAKTSLVSTCSWDQFVSYRVLDTCTIAQFLRVTGKLPADLSCSLTNLGEYFNVQVNGVPHEAKYDVLVTAKVLENLFKI